MGSGAGPGAGPGAGSGARWWLQPTWLARHAAILVLFAATVALGLWQLDRTLDVHRASVRKLPSPAPVSLEQAVKPSPSGGVVTEDRFGAVVEFVGRLDLDHLLWLPTSDVTADAATSWSLAAPVRVSQGPLAGRHLVAELGSVRQPAQGSAIAARLPEGDVPLRGWLSVADSTSGGAASVTPPGPGSVVPDLDPAVLVNVLPYPVVDGVLHLGAPEIGGVTADPRPTQRTSGRWPLQNAAYAVQWWLFGVAGLWWWSRVLRDEGALRRRRAIEGGQLALADQRVRDDAALGEEGGQGDRPGERHEDGLADRPPLLQ